MGSGGGIRETSLLLLYALWPDVRMTGGSEVDAGTTQQIRMGSFFPRTGCTLSASSGRVSNRREARESTPGLSRCPKRRANFKEPGWHAGT
jgi:hypothetical protein